MTGRQFEVGLRAGAHAELARLADGLRQEAEKRLPKDRGALAAPVSVTACTPPQLAVMVAGRRVPLHAAHPMLDRIDLVIRSYVSEVHLLPQFEVLHGVPATSPRPPTLTSNGCREETALAQVRVKAGQVQVTQADIYPPDAEVTVRRPAPDSSWLAMENAETMRRRYKAGGPVSLSFFPVMPLRLEPAKPPEPSKREVLTVEAGLFTVAGWCLATIDRVLAECVAREFDRIDPLPPVEGP